MQRLRPEPFQPFTSLKGRFPTVEKSPFICPNRAPRDSGCYYGTQKKAPAERDHDPHMHICLVNAKGEECQTQKALQYIVVSIFLSIIPIEPEYSPYNPCITPLCSFHFLFHRFNRFKLLVWLLAHRKDPPP